jgi:hypothetical protein
MAGELIPAVRRRARPAPPARAATVPLVPLPPDQFARRRRDAKVGYPRADSTKRCSTEHTHDRVVRRKTPGEGRSSRRRRNLVPYRRFRCNAPSFCLLTCARRSHGDDRAVVSNCGDSENR